MPTDPPTFVWPPKRTNAPVEVVAVPTPGMSESPSECRGRARRASRPDTRPSPSAATLDGSRPHPWHHFEATWLDVTAPPLARRLAALGWQPDAPDAYCSRCGQTHDPPGSACGGCPQRLPWQRLIRLGPYSQPLSRLIHEIKFTRWRRLGRDVGGLLGQAVAAQLPPGRSKTERIAVVHVPTSLVRRLIRGIDHSAVLARAVADRTGARFFPILRRRYRPAQTALPASRRAANIAGSIYPRWRKADLADTLIIVVDDVTTTGATLRAACRAIQKAARQAGLKPVPIWAAVVAVTPKQAV